MAMSLTLHTMKVDEKLIKEKVRQKAVVGK
jgi:hypothetical protein